MPLTSVVNLSQIFDREDEGTRFVKRYLKATHCDLFFADGAVLVEGPAERIVLPHFVRNRSEYTLLNRAYITWLEIGGSHAHRLQTLIEALGLDTLVITDLDAMDPGTKKKAVPKRGANLETRNPTLRNWLPAISSLDELLDHATNGLERNHPLGGAVRVAYQQPVNVTLREKPEEALANTFEDALLYENLSVFVRLDGGGLIGKFKALASEHEDIDEIAVSLKEEIRSRDKAPFALDILFKQELQELELPKYIADGFLWLSTRLDQDAVSKKVTDNSVHEASSHNE